MFDMFFDLIHIRVEAKHAKCETRNTKHNRYISSRWDLCTCVMLRYEYPLVGFLGVTPIKNHTVGEMNVPRVERNLLGEE